MKAGEILELEGKNNTFSHAYLLVGNDQAEIELTINGFIASKKCLPQDISILKPENEAVGKGAEIKIDDVRELLHRVNLSPQGSCRIAIIYNAEKLNQSSGNILLKTLEEPPKSLTMILVSSSEGILPTIKSRCRVLKVGSVKGADPTGLEEVFKKRFFEATTTFEQIIKEERLNLLFRDTIAYLRKKLLDKKSKATVAAIKKVMAVQKQINQNANPRLALENLYLEIKNEFNA